MPKLKLYHYPVRACSTVTFNALEEANLEYDDQSIDIIAGEQKSPEYLKVHPGGKVPALVVDDKVLTENAAILGYLNMLAPQANLLPQSDDLYERASCNSDLIWISSTFHPAIRQMRMPLRFTHAEGEYAGIQAKGVEFTTAIFDQLEARFSGDRWWYGENWSVVDAYISWCVMIVMSTQIIDMDKYPGIMSHTKRVHERPSFQRAMARQIASKERDGIKFQDEV
ncbi:MAG: glutathione S-transferase family protein [Pseudomonadota bacterium]